MLIEYIFNVRKDNKMNSELLTKLGLDSIDPACFLIAMAVLLIISVALTIVCIVKLSKVNERYEKFMKGKDGKSLESLVTEKISSIDQLLADSKKKTKEVAQIFDNLKITVQKVGIVKYDAFSEMGGKLSFALAMLNEENSGFIINSMHSREGCYTYIKEITKGESYIPLGKEEKEAMDRAMGIDY